MSSKLREALNQLLGLIDNEILVFNDSIEPSEISQAQYHIDKAGEAYEEPLRNCDVGTAEEQIKRHRAYCKDPNMMCGRSSSLVCRKCFAEWAQMPYEKEGVNETNK